MIALGSDHGGYGLKQEIIRYLEEKGIEYKDYGCYDERPCDYPVYGKKRSAGCCIRGVREGYPDLWDRHWHFDCCQ